MRYYRVLHCVELARKLLQLLVLALLTKQWIDLLQHFLALLDLIQG
jgi:hypothetical protein